ncbi:MAG: HD domain-containing protein [Candidatus Nanosalina sp.]
MEFQDPVYGRQKVEEKVLQELVESEPVQRLKNVNQAGTAHFMDKPAVTRFQHSLGVMFLLRSHGAPLEEQIAGLLHDVPHTAFSHVADFIFRNKEHEYHERFMEQIVFDSRIPEILERHGFDVDYILDESNFLLLERDIPDLCADRIDYFLRDTTVYGHEDLSHLRSGLAVVDDLFVLENEEVGERYALKYIESDERYWAHPKEVAIFEIFARALRRAMEIGLIEEEDLFGTDRELLEKVNGSEDPVVRENMEMLQNGLEIQVGGDDYDFIGETKPRYVDPQVLKNGELVRISELSERVAERIEEHEEEVGSGYKISII